jgi:geranylgeranyl pyrophosphate synthase
MDERTTSIWNLIEAVWQKSGAWPQLIEAMRFSLTSRTAGGRDPETFMGLPGLCCQAAGGQAAWADALAAAWMMFYTAAHLMDSLEDQDEPDAWWAELGPGAALHVATGLFFSASLALQELHALPLERDTLQAAISLALQPFMRMSSGQYADYLAAPQSLEEYWRIAEAKSGEFFALACRAGARLASAEPHILDGFGQYGMHAGVLVQILDDLADYRSLLDETGGGAESLAAGSLLELYIGEVCSPEQRARFERLLQSPGAQARRELIRLLEQNGAGLYLLAEQETRRSRALQALRAAARPGLAANTLEQLLQAL